MVEIARFWEAEARRESQPVPLSTWRVTKPASWAVLFQCTRMPGALEVELVGELRAELLVVRGLVALARRAPLVEEARCRT